MRKIGKLGSKSCVKCGSSFEYELFNKSRAYCSVSCAVRSKGGYDQHAYIEKAQQKHALKFDYSRLPATFKSKDKIEIVCKTHGVFLQQAGQHLLGKGCRSCANEGLRKTTEQFVNEAVSIHGSKYDYSRVVYKNYMDHVEIICPKHGLFTQSPSQHLANKAGCSDCVTIIRASAAEKSWLDSVGVPDNNDHRQVTIGRMIVDGLVDNTVYEYFGDYWHGNPDKFKQSDYNKSCKKTFGQLHSETIARIDALKALGYHVEYIWESQWLKN